MAKKIKEQEPNAIARSRSLPYPLSDDDLAKDPRILAVAKWLAQGKSPEKAVKKSGYRARSLTEAQRFCALPEVTALVSAYKQGVHAVVQAATPLALQRNLELMLGLHGATAAVQQKAADSILDRGGVPKVNKQIIDRRTEVADSLGALLGGADKVAIVVEKGIERAQEKLEAGKEIEVEQPAKPEQRSEAEAGHEVAAGA